jgi:hypothetical protein
MNTPAPHNEAAAGNRPVRVEIQQDDEFCWEFYTFADGATVVYRNGEVCESNQSFTRALGSGFLQGREKSS